MYSYNRILLLDCNISIRLNFKIWEVKYNFGIFVIFRGETQLMCCMCSVTSQLRDNYFTILIDLLHILLFSEL